MSGNGRGTRRRFNWTLFWTAVGALAAIAGVLATLGFFSSSDPERSEGSVATGAGSHSPEKPGDSSTPTGPEIPQAGEKLWSGEISLVLEELYALDGFPIEPYNGYYCDGCLMINRYSPEVSFEVENGVREWGEPSPPSYADCVRLLESGPALAISLVASTGRESLEAGEWVCAFSLSGQVLRLRYEGVSQDGVNYRFAATGWNHPL